MLLQTIQSSTAQKHCISTQSLHIGTAWYLIDIDWCLIHSFIQLLWLQQTKLSTSDQPSHSGPSRMLMHGPSQAENVLGMLVSENVLGICVVCAHNTDSLFTPSGHSKRAPGQLWSVSGCLQALIGPRPIACQTNREVRGWRGTRESGRRRRKECAKMQINAVIISFVHIAETNSGLKLHAHV